MRDDEKLEEWGKEAPELVKDFASAVTIAPLPDEVTTLAPTAPKRTLCTDPTLELPPDTLTPEEKVRCEHYRITEASLTREQKLELLKVLEKHKKSLARSKFKSSAASTTSYYLFARAPTASEK